MVLGQVDYVKGSYGCEYDLVGSCWAHFAIKQGVGYVKLFIIITAILILKML